MKNIIATITLAAIAMTAACGGGASNTATSNNSANKPSNASASNASSTSSSTATPAAMGEASKVVKDIFENAIKRNCAAIPPMVVEDFRKEIKNTPDELEALCDLFTDSGKLESIEIKGETLTGDTGKVKVTRKMKDGKTEDKEEGVRKENGKWLLDS